MYYTTYPSPIGLLTLTSDGTSITGLWMEKQKYYMGTITDELHRDDRLLIFIKAKEWLDRYFVGEKPEITELSLAPAGSEFRQLVWEILCEIPYGSTMTYGQVAQKVAGRMKRPRMSAQAVGGAIGHNPISIIIPCHRVVGTDGSLTGYAGGNDRKQFLLTHERARLATKDPYEGIYCIGGWR